MLTIDPSRPRAQAVAIGGGRVMVVGSNDDVRGWVSPGVLVRDLAGQTLLPGFYDSHNHKLLTGLNLAAVDLSGAKSVADVVRVMGERVAGAPLGQWVLSSARWHESQLAEGRFPRGILSDCARRLSGLPVLFVGVHCAIEVVMERRRATWGAATGDDGSVPTPVSLWQQAVHLPGIYDLEVDTSILSPEACANLVGQRLENGPPPLAFRRLAAMARP